MIVFFKKSQGVLFDAPVHVAGHVRRDGSVVAPHMRIQKVASKKPEAVGQTLDLFAPKPDTVEMPRTEAVEEHNRLVEVLESPSHEDDKAEAKKQAAELKEYESKPKPRPKRAKRKNSQQPVQEAAPPEPLPEPVAAPLPVAAEPHDRAAPFGVPAGITKGERRAINAKVAALVSDGQSDPALMRQYSGNGGCGDSLNEFYTDAGVARSMWDTVTRLGAATGTALEPSCGTGVFMHTAPEGFRVTGVELEPISSACALALHGDRHEVHTASFERFATTDDRQFDVVIGNPPYGPRGFLAKDDKVGISTAEAYFVDTSLDKCKPGGIVALVVPTGILDSRTNRSLREAMLRKGEFLGAQRMPNTAFEHSHTEVTTDVIYLRKRGDDVAGALSTVGQDALQKLGVWDEDFLAGSYFTGRGAGNVLGTMEAGWRAKAGMGNDITVNGSMQGVADAIAEFVPDGEARGAAALTVPDILEALPDDAARDRALSAAARRTYANTAKVGDTKTVDGINYVLQGDPPRWHRVDEFMQSEAISAAQEVASRIEAAMAGGGRDGLADAVNAYVAKHGIPANNPDLMTAASVDKTLYRLIGAVNRKGELSDAVLGRERKTEGSFDSYAQTMALDERGDFSAADLAERLGRPADEVADQLAADQRYASLGGGRWTTMDTYLTGELWPKLDAARAAIAAGDDLEDKLQHQVQRLEEVIDQKSLDDVDVQINSAFLPAHVLEAYFNWRQFDSDRANEWTKKQAPVSIKFADGVYTIEGGNTWGDSKLLDKYLNRSGVKKDDKPTLDEWNAEFKDWLCASAYREAVEDLYNRKFRGFVAREFSDAPIEVPGLTTDRDVRSWRWSSLRRSLADGKGIVADDVGLGKAQPLDAKILTPTGWVLMGDIKVGDQVISVDGTPTTVLGVYPQGEKEIYRVEFHDGSSTECCDEHLWVTQTHKGRNNERRSGMAEGEGAPKVRTLSEIRETLTYRGMKNHAIPMVEPVAFEARKTPIDPYVLGVLIGDGSFTNDSVSFTSVDQQIATMVADALDQSCPTVSVKLRMNVASSRAPTYRISRRRAGVGFNPVWRDLVALGLQGKTSESKFVPECYLFNSVDVRLAMLQGLMDTDGYVCRKGVTVQFSSSSERLARDVQFLVNSLGGNATIKSKIPTFTGTSGTKKSGLRHYTVHMRMPPDAMPFRLQRKIDRVRPKSKYIPTRYITAVVPAGRKLAQCIMVDHPSHLYVTDDFIVTHNTLGGLLLARMAKIDGRATKPTIVVPKSVLANWFAESQTWFPGSRVLTIGANFSYKDGELVGKDDSAAERKRKYHDLTQNDYDFVLISEPSFEEVDLDPETKERYYSDDFWVQRGDKLGNAGDKRRKKIKEAYEQSVASREFQDRTDAIHFGDLGVDMLIQDEMHHCFPPGTLVDGAPVENLRAGDMIKSINHSTGNVEFRRVVDVAAMPARTLCRVHLSSGKSIVSTDNHRFFTLQRGYVEAAMLVNSCDVMIEASQHFKNNRGAKEEFPQGETSRKENGLHTLREYVHDEWRAAVEGGHWQSVGVLLQPDVFGAVEGEAARLAGLAAVTGDSSEAKCGPDGEQLAADACRKSEENGGAAGAEGANESSRANCSRRQWKGPDSAAAFSGARAWVGDGTQGAHQNGQPLRLSRALQNRHFGSGADDCNRGGWIKPPLSARKGEGCAQDAALEVARVVRVEILEPGGDGEFERLCPEGLVYDIEVEGNHNFFAEGVLVHNSKNLFSARARFGEQPKFLGGQGLSNRALDFNLKCRWIREKNGGKGIYGLTATPTKNSPLEIYSMLSHIAPEAFEKIGVRNSEEFLDRFCEFQNDKVLSTQGDIEDALVVSGFKNLTELREIMSRFIDRRTAEEVGLKLPTRSDRLHLVDMTAKQQGVYADLRELAEKAKEKDSTGDAHIFSVMDKMNKAALDLQLLGGEHAGAHSPKYAEMAKQAKEGLKEGAQIIFSEYIDSHERIASALVDAGVPRNRIGIINAQVAGSAVKRQNIADALNNGKLDVVIGNATMAEGLNMQVRTTDIHHADVPWEPATLQQRNGRGLRQGNRNEALRVHTYLSRGSFDGYRYQSVGAKKDWQDLLWNGGDRVDNLAREGQFTRDDMRIMLAADPEAARAEFEKDKTAAQQRYDAGKRVEAVSELVRFQYMKRSYAGLKNKNTASATRLRQKLESARTSLFNNKHFPDKSVLDSDKDVLIEPDTGLVVQSGVAFHATKADGGEEGKFVVTGVNMRAGTVTVRRYADTSGGRPRTVPLKELAAGIKPFKFDADAEAAEVSTRIAADAEAALVDLKDWKSLKQLPPDVIERNAARLQEHIKAGAKNYKFNFDHGSVPMVNRETGKIESFDSYDHSRKHDTHDYLLPTADVKEKLTQAWIDAERGAKLGTKFTQHGRKNNQRSTWPAAREYDGAGYNEKHTNPFKRLLESASGGAASSYGDDGPAVREARTRLHAEQMQRIRRADSLPAIFDALVPLAKPNGTDHANNHATYPKEALSMAWARARHIGALDKVPNKGRHSGYAVGQGGQQYGEKDRNAHAALMSLAAGSGHQDLAEAMAESAERHAPDASTPQALSVLSEHHTPSPRRVAIMRKIAARHGLTDKTIGQLREHHLGGSLAATNGYGNYSYTSAAQRQDKTLASQLDELQAQADEWSESQKEAA